MKRALLLVLVLALAAGCTSPAADHEQVSAEQRLVAHFSHVTAENSPKHLAAIRFASAAKQQSAGHIDMQIYPNSQLYKDFEELAALQEGSIQFVAVAPAKLVKFDPAWQVFDLPYLFRAFEDVERLFDSPLTQQMRKRLEAQGLIALEIWPNAFMQFTNQRRPLVTPGDFAGLTFRVQAGEVRQDMYETVAARGVVTPFTAVYAELERGAIDGQENTLNNIYTRNLLEVQPYLTISDHGYLGYVVLTQARWWNGLDQADRRALQAGLQEATQWVRENAEGINREALDRIRSSGRVEMTTLSPEQRMALRKAFEPVYDRVESRLGSDFLRAVIRDAKGP